MFSLGFPNITFVIIPATKKHSNHTLQELTLTETLWMFYSLSIYIYIYL
jgi:hypothetical protein